MEFKIGDLVRVKDCEETKILEMIGMIEIGKAGKIIKDKKIMDEQWHCVGYNDGDADFIPAEWLEPVIEEEPVVDGAKIQIVYNGQDLDILAENGTKINIDDKYINALYGVVDALYDLIGIKLNGDDLDD